MSETGKCVSCGKETDRRIWGEADKRWAVIHGMWDKFKCQKCADAAAALDDWQNEQWHTDEITCPWCGEEMIDSWEVNLDYDNEYECTSCGRTFEVERNVERNVEVTYTSRKRECDYEGDE